MAILTKPSATTIASMAEGEGGVRRPAEAGEETPSRHPDHSQPHNSTNRIRDVAMLCTLCLLPSARPLDACVAALPRSVLTLRSDTLGHGGGGRSARRGSVAPDE
jgi:ferredoxin